MKCKRCGAPFEPRAYRGGSKKLYCSEKCRRVAGNARYDRRYPEKKRTRQSKYDKSEQAKSRNRERLKDPALKQMRIARDAVRSAVKRGEIIKPEICSNCLTAGKVEAHHYKGYGFTLDVHWLCRKCHRNEH